MNKMLRVYRSFLPGIFIGLFFALLLSSNSSQLVPEDLRVIDQPILVLIFSGILGGVLYTIMLDGYVELPRFRSKSGASFEAGLFGDLLIGIAGAFVFDLLTESFVFSSVGSNDPEVALKVIAAKGIIGGYGGRTLMETAHKKFLKRVEKLEDEKESVAQENQELAQEVVELTKEKEQLIQGAELIDQLNAHVKGGLPESSLSLLLNSIEAAPDTVKSQIFNIAKDLRSLNSRTEATRPRTQRTVPIFQTLVDGEPGNHEYHAQLAFALKDAVRPELAKALTHIDQAINLRGRLDNLQGKLAIADNWKYELNRAVIQMQKKYAETGTFVSPPHERNQILKDLLTVSKTHDLAKVLEDAKAKNISTPILDWLMENKVWSDGQGNGSDLVQQLQNILRTGISQTATDLENIKQVLTQKVNQAIPLSQLPRDAMEALNIGLTQLGVLNPQDASQIDGLSAMNQAWRAFTAQAMGASEHAGVVDPSSVGLLISALEQRFGRNASLPDFTDRSSRTTTQTDSTWIATDSNSTNGTSTTSPPTPTAPTAPILTSPIPITPTTPTLTNLVEYPNFPKNFTFLGRCYDILTLDPLNTSESAKEYMAFYFSPDAGEIILGETNQLKPKGTNYMPGASGGFSVNARTQVLQTASDTQALFANTLGGGILALVSKILPFSNSFSYKKFKRARTQERSVYTVTKADYIDYSLSLKQGTLWELPLDSQFRQAVEQLPTTQGAAQYDAFIQKFGTHVSTQVKFGGLAYRCIRLNESLYTELTQRGVDLQLEAAKLFKMGFSKQEQGIVNREISESSETFHVNGGLPSGDWESWFRSIQADPAPVKMELEPLHELLTSDFFPQDSQIALKQQLMQESVVAYLEREADKPGWELWKSVALGGQGAVSFADIDVSPNDLANNLTQYKSARAVEVKVRSGAGIDRVQLVLNVGALPPHGGEGGHEQTLSLAEGEYISSIQVTEGSVQMSVFRTFHNCITYIKIITTNGNKLEAGRRTGPLLELEIPDNYQVIGFHGSSGGLIDSLGVIASPLPHLFEEKAPIASSPDSIPVLPPPNSGTWDSPISEVPPIYSIDEVRSLLETEVNQIITFSEWSPRLMQVVCVALIRLGFLKQSGSPQIIFEGWKKFKADAHLSDPETIGPGSVKSLLKAIARQSTAIRKLSPTSSDVPILFDKPFPEVQVKGPNYKKYFNKVIGSVLVTGGFMEPTGHGFKSLSRKAIYKNGALKTISPGPYNIGFDYTKGFGSKVICMYSGTVTKAGIEWGYGHRIHIKLDVPFTYKGKDYTCYQAYAHCSQLLKVTGQRVAQGDAIGIEAGHGGRHAWQYGSHVDLDTYFQINGETVHLNFELLAGNASAKDYIEAITPMDLDSLGLDVRWLQQKLKIKADGHYGPNTQKAVKTFQKENTLLVDGIAGEVTCRALGLIGFAIYANKSSSLKNSPSELQGTGLLTGEGTLPLLANWVENADEDHWYVELKEPLNNLKGGYLDKDEVELVHGYDATEDSLTEEERGGDIVAAPNSQSEGIWHTALKNCPTEGCKLATATAEGLAQAGIPASHEIAKRDLKNITRERLEAINRVSEKFDVPREIIAALASRESHFGTLLGKFGNKPGWGDHNQGFGILQVDRQKGKRAIMGRKDPYSQAHVDQAMEIFTRSRDEVSIKHPQWSIENKLKGACVAYNAGVSNVQTIEGMNIGTTHDDYGDDVIARAQFYLTVLNEIDAQ